jgi:hypothetical protein
MSGFEFRETMSGSYHLLDQPDQERPFSFSVRARSVPWLRFLREPLADIEGEVDAEGFADHCALRGTMLLDLVRGRRLGYRFDFADNEGKRRVFRGEKLVELTRLAHTMTTLPGAIEDEGGREVGRVLVRFDARSDLVQFLRSFRAQR